MDKKRIVFLTSLDPSFCELTLRFLEGGECEIVSDLDSLIKAKGDVLLSFGTSVIVPSDVLGRFSLGTYNIHAASSAYPGRDPHHWAVYDKVARYAATAHVMTEKVDEGPIVDEEWFPVPDGISPKGLLELANCAALKILARIGPRLKRGERLEPLPNAKWRGVKRSRSDFLRMCEISPGITEEEFMRRFHAFDGGSYNNLFLKIHGCTFRIDKT